MIGKPTRKMFSAVGFIRTYLNVPEPNMNSFDDVSKFINDNLFEANVEKYYNESKPRSSSFLNPSVDIEDDGMEYEDEDSLW